jgi:hypothetical protein
LKRHKSRLDLKARLDVTFQRKGGGKKETKMTAEAGASILRLY